MNVLIVEDEPGVSRFLEQACREAGVSTVMISFTIVNVSPGESQF